MEELFISGNHLAAVLVEKGCFPDAQKSYEQVLHDHGGLCADVWIAWKAIMSLRDKESA
jgi:hypothetical protein